jgi:hypothetical protein
MHIAPFHFVAKHTDTDFLGYLVYKPSRRNKDKVRVYMNVGAGNDFIGELDITIDLENNKSYFQYDYYEFFAYWLEMHEYDLEYVGVNMPGEDRNEEYLRQWLEGKDVQLRFW